MPNVLANTKMPIWVYVIRAYLIVLLTNIPIVVYISIYFPDSEKVQFELSWIGVFSVLIVVPALETLLILPIIFFIKFFIKDVLIISLLSAFFWGWIHYLIVPLQGLAVMPLFFIMTMAFQYWDTISRTLALFTVMSIHTLNNSMVLLLVWIFMST